MNLREGESEVKTVGIIGCGAIGTLIAQAADNGTVKCDRLVLYDYNAEKAEKLRDSIHVKAKTVRNIDELIDAKPTVVVEAASQQAAKEFTSKTTAKNIDLIIMSVGALLDVDTVSPKIHVPSGAIGGLDAISAAALAGIDEVVLTTRKALQVPGVSNEREKLVFEGKAREAVRLFPREMNVAAALELAAGPDKVKVRVISDPKASRNTHEVKVTWKFGNMHFVLENVPHPDNPKTSALAAYSAIRLLKQLLEDNWEG